MTFGQIRTWAKRKKVYLSDVTLERYLRALAYAGEIEATKVSNVRFWRRKDAVQA